MIKKKINKTKIIATVGPASNTKEKLRELILEGVDVFRLNFSHGTYDDHQKVVGYVRELNTELDTNICLLQDLQGPKIRVSEVEPDTVLNNGDTLTITNKQMLGNSEIVSTIYQNLCNDVEIGDPILVDDGKIELKVIKVEGENVVTKVIHGGLLKSRKGINLPSSIVSAPSLTEKDLKDLTFGIKNDIEWIALSFVRKPEDIIQLKELIKKEGKDSRIVAKIEKPEAVKNIQGIIKETDAIMVARGDLGVEISMEEVPIVQKHIVKLCIEAAKPVIIATQMMESMINNPRPTRAETNDVANAVMDGADTLMLSAETASGKFPVEVIKSMTKTITSVENQADVYFNHYVLDKNDPLFFNNTLVLASARLAKVSKAKAIIGMTASGYTAFKIASFRPKARIFIFTNNRPLLKTINLIWGVEGIYYDREVSTDDTFSDIEKILKDKNYISKGDIFITTASMPMEKRGRTNAMKLNIVE